MERGKYLNYEQIAKIHAVGKAGHGETDFNNKKKTSLAFHSPLCQQFSPHPFVCLSTGIYLAMHASSPKLYRVSCKY